MAYTIKGLGQVQKYGTNTFSFINWFHPWVRFVRTLKNPEENVQVENIIGWSVRRWFLSRCLYKLLNIIRSWSLDSTGKTEMGHWFNCKIRTQFWFVNWDYYSYFSGFWYSRTLNWCLTSWQIWSYKPKDMLSWTW